MNDLPMQTLRDLTQLRSAPELTDQAATSLRRELAEAMASAHWFTIGVMAPSADAALKAMRALEANQSWDPLELIETSDQAGPVFLKANQRVGSIRIRIEHGLGQGILITGHSDDDSQASYTWGPLPLDFF